MYFPKLGLCLWRASKIGLSVPTHIRTSASHIDLVSRLSCLNFTYPVDCKHGFCFNGRSFPLSIPQGQHPLAHISPASYVPKLDIQNPLIKWDCSLFSQLKGNRYPGTRNEDRARATESPGLRSWLCKQDRVPDMSRDKKGFQKCKIPVWHSPRA